jgi:uncharacterized integral membrane protein (TIGR00697 family)
MQLPIAPPPTPTWTRTREPFPQDTAATMPTAYHPTIRNPRLLLGASMAAYLVAQLFDVRLYHFWWRVTAGRHMWVRNNGSTLISQLVDTAIVNSIFLRFGLNLDWPAIGGVILASYLVKVVFAALDTPVIYLARHALEGFLRIEKDPRRREAPLA